MKSLYPLLLVLGALPLLCYPFVLLANLMTLAGHRSGHESLGLMVAVYAFLIGSTAYPLVYFLCFGFVIVRLKEKKVRAAIRYSAAPLLYIALLAILMMFWSVG